MEVEHVSAFVVAVIGLAQGLNLWLTQRIKKDTRQVNNAVNHVEPGKLSLTARVDSIVEDVEWMRAVNLVTKTEFERLFLQADEKHDTLRGMVAGLADGQESIVKELSKVRESVDRRKQGEMN